MVEPTSGTLFVVSTPIGNLGDFSFRGVEVLKAVNVVLSEDTRHTRKLLTHFGISSKLVSCHEHNETAMIPRVIALLAAGESAALVSDAGTPLLSDPGERLVRAVREAGFNVIPVPGASALLAALVTSGLSVVPFTFLGFLPRKGGDRQAMIQQIAASHHTMVIYEAANRLSATLDELAALSDGDRRCVVSREVTKLHEESRDGALNDLARHYEATAARGEVVIMVEGARHQEPHENDVMESLQEYRRSGMSRRDIVTALTRDFGMPRNRAYALAHSE